MIGWAVVVVGVLLAGSQAFAATPWQAGIAIGVLLAVFGGLVVVEGADRRL